MLPVRATQPMPPSFPKQACVLAHPVGSIALVSALPPVHAYLLCLLSLLCCEELLAQRGIQLVYHFPHSHAIKGGGGVLEGPPKS